MNFKIAIGQYYPINSIIHKLDPRIKFLGLIFFMSLLFIANSFIAYGISSLFLFLVLILTKVPLKFFFKGLRMLLYIIIFTSILNLIFFPGETVLFRFFFLTLYLEAIIATTLMTARLTLLIISSSVLSLTTTPIDLTTAIEYILKPFKLVRLPVHEISMMMTIALRFIPTLLEEAEKIVKAQTARGANFGGKGIIARAKSFVPILVPLFVSAFRRADDLALAMEARCYRGDINRTKINVLKFRRNDYLAILTLVFFMVILFLI